MSNPFNFGPAPASSGASSGSIFGTPSTSAGTGGSLFGSGGTGFTFGQNTGGNSTTSTGPSKNFFGQQSTQSPASPPIFNTPKPATSSTSIPTSAAATPANSNLQQSWGISNPSTTPAGNPPAASVLGASTGGMGGIFGQQKTTQDNTSKTPTFNLGGNQAPIPNTQSATPNIFGAPPAKPAEPSPALPPSAGQTPKFNFGKAEASASPASTAAPSPFFTASTSKPAATPNIFGGAAPQPTTTAPAATPSLFSQPASSSAPDNAKKPTFSFPPAPTQSQSSSTPATSSESTQAKPASLGLNFTSSSAAPSNPLFSAKPVPSASAPGTTATGTAGATSSAPSFSFPPSQAPTAQAPATTSATGLSASTTGPLPVAQSRLKNKTMDEILTRWATDLTKYTKEFKAHADTVATWDQLIVSHASKIDKLYVKTRTCEKQTMSVEMQLSAVENQQTELEGWLAKYEADVDAMLAKEGGTKNELGGPDQERERTYKLAERLSERIDDIGRDLGSMVDEVNAANASLSRNGKGDEPITQIVRILNSHLSQLQAIDQGTATLQAKVAEAQKTATGIGYLTGPGNGSVNGNAVAADDFMRSYMGRR